MRERYIVVIIRFQDKKYNIIKENYEKIEDNLIGGRDIDHHMIVISGEDGHEKYIVDKRKK